MCGIAGSINFPIDKNRFTHALNTLKRRGPDSFGIFEHNNNFLGHRRLSILDLSELGNQPFIYKNLVVVFNGEIYNYKEIRNELIKLGYSFISNSDTEVIIKSFYEWGVKSVERFIGMFSFALYNTTSNEIYVFRDRIGVKPLYYYFNNNQFIFASELKFFKQLNLKLSIDNDAIYQYFKFGYITNDNSIFYQIKKVLPGHYLKFSYDKLEEIEYWNPTSEHVNQFDFSNEKEVKDNLNSLLKSAFNFRMVADVPIGVFLSGGTDSSLVTSILQATHNNINTFTIGFDSDKHNEAHYAKQIANYLKTNHHEFILKGSEAKNLLVNFYDIYDEPFSDSSGIPTALVSELAKKNGVKVVLSADGGDELFHGYSRYNDIINRSKYYLNHHFFINRIQTSFIEFLHKNKLLNISMFNTEHKLCAHRDFLVAKNFDAFYEASISNQGDLEINALLKKGITPFSSIRPIPNSINENHNRMMLWDIMHYLPDDLLVKVDRATMYNSIEGREPFLDHRLIEFALQLPINYKFRNGQNKYILKKILSEYIPNEFINRPKMGFSIPLFKWFDNELGDLMKFYFNVNRLKRIDVLNTEEVLKEYNRYLYFKEKGLEYNIEKIWRILSLIMWWEKWIES